MTAGTKRYAKDLGGMNALIHKSTEAFVGMAGLLVQQVDGRSELEIGYSLLPGFRGSGFATEAAVHAKQHAFKRQLAESLISIIHIRNIPSQQVALRNGMQLEKSTTYKDNPVFIYRINN